MRPLLLCLLLPACTTPALSVDPDDTEAADTDGAPDDGGPDDGGPVDLPTSCPDVCFVWGDRVANPPPPPPGPPGMTWVSTQCNNGGVDPGNCPDGFTCGRTESTFIGPGYVSTAPVCEGDGGPYELVIDRAPPAVPADGVTVDLRFTLNQGAWPAGPEGSAGTISFAPREAGPTLAFDMPTRADGHLRVVLAPGDYDVRFSATGLDPTRYPTLSRPAAIAVVDDGEVELDVVAWPAGFSLRLDDQPVPTVTEADLRLTVTWHGLNTLRVSRALLPGDAVGTPVLLEPDDYQVFITGSGLSSRFPAGQLPAGIPHEVPEDEAPEVLPVALRTQTYSGTVTVNGQPWPEDTFGQASIVSGGASSLVTLDDAGRVQGRVWRGNALDVSLKTYGTDLVPNGTLHLLTGHTGGPFTVDVPVTNARGVVTVNGARPPTGSRGEVLQVLPDGSRAALSLAYNGDAAFDGPVYNRTGDIYVESSGSALPVGINLIRAGAPPTSAPLTLDLTGWPVTLTVRVNGRAHQGDGRPRGILLLTRIDPSTDEPVPSASNPLYFESESLTFPTTGPLVAQGLVGEGTWQVMLASSGEHLPQGSVILGEIEVDGPVQQTFDAFTADLNFTLLIDGETPPAGISRGTFTISGQAHDLPSSGPARVETTVWRGLTSGSWTCSPTEGCPLLDSYYLTLWSSLEP
jgi:hypothetical protein